MKRSTKTTRVRPATHPKPRVGPGDPVEAAGVVCDALLHSTEALLAGREPAVGVLALAMALGCYADAAAVSEASVLDVVREAMRASAELRAEEDAAAAPPVAQATGSDN